MCKINKFIIKIENKINHRLQLIKNKKMVKIIGKYSYKPTMNLKVFKENHNKIKMYKVKIKNMFNKVQNSSYMYFNNKSLQIISLLGIFSYNDLLYLFALF